MIRTWNMRLEDLRAPLSRLRPRLAMIDSSMRVKASYQGPTNEPLATL